VLFYVLNLISFACWMGANVLFRWQSIFSKMVGGLVGKQLLWSNEVMKMEKSVQSLFDIKACKVGHYMLPGMRKFDACYLSHFW